MGLDLAAPSARWRTSRGQARPEVGASDAGRRAGVVDQIGDVRRQAGEDGALLGRRQPAGADLGVEVRVRRGDDRVLETAYRLALRGRDVGERLARLQL